ncbi:3-coathanger stack domain-containing protein [Emticicia sp. C21]|uniref:3-coathanger stack domain-containing protein n=1 Tax=Emticicia sp. C21 TaxID=2302915 RepID=UPI000E348AE6|nr:3-coathanger stack domain-containing protein [Emticicia sp. C21]RFS16638.1 hypothetical protein D0T08_08105 [Emticicia sp. C21]
MNLRFILFFLLTTSFHSYSQRLLKDIASSDASSNINQSFVDFNNNLIKGDTLFFLAQDTSFFYKQYKDIWFTTGTAASTRKVTSGDYYSSSFYTFLTSFKGKAYFKNLYEPNLYAADGNTITVVKTFNNSIIKKAGIINGWLYVFVSNNTNNTLELWKTDGTEANTSKITDVYSGTHFFYDTLYESNFLSTGEKIYFKLTTDAYDNEPWVTDGTSNGTRLLKNTVNGPSLLKDFKKVGNTVFFCAYNTINQSKLWKTDGTEAGTVVVADAIDGNQNYNPQTSISYNNELYFIANDNKFYKTDGSTITLVRDNLTVLHNQLMLGDIVKMNDLMYFIRKNAFDFELWKSDGTNNGTQKIKTILMTPYNNYMNIRILAGTSKIYFQLAVTSGGVFENITQHWVSDGTAEGTINISTLNPIFSNGSYNDQLAVVGDTYYFTAYDALNGFELWKSNGTPIGTMMVKNINQSVTSSAPAQFVAFNDEVYFTADDIKHGREIWKTDGASANTTLVADLNASSISDINYSSDVSGMIAYNDVIIAQITHQLVKFNKTMPPTVFFVSTHGNPKNPEFTRFNNKIYYKGWVNDNNPGGGGYELFATDGTDAGTAKVKDFSNYYLGGDPSNLLVWDGLLYFITEDNTKIWKSDGTEIGTVLVKNLTGGTIKSKFYEANGVLLFLYESPTYGLELWKTDGTEAGTVLVKDINPGVGGAGITNPAVYNNNLFFVATNGSSYALYKSDGTSANTQVFSSVISTNIPAVFKNKLFFISYDPNGYALWAIDGNSAPVKIQKLTSTMHNAGAAVLMNVNEEILVFDVAPNTARHELWASNGTTAGTKLVKIIRQKEFNDTSIRITEYIYNNRKLYFAVDDGINGKELWMWDFDCQELMTITNPITQDYDYTVDKYIVGSNKINANIKASYNANKYITLNPGFETKAGARFSATMNGCIVVATSSNSSSNEPVFKNFPTKVDAMPGIIQFLNNPINAELLSVYLSEKENNKEQNIVWIFDESPDKYILKMHVNEKEYIGYLNK